MAAMACDVYVRNRPSLNQERLLLYEEAAARFGHRPNFHPVRVAFRVPTNLNLSALQQALDALVQRHAMLRTMFQQSDRHTSGERNRLITYFARTHLFRPGMYATVVPKRATVTLKVVTAPDDLSASPTALITLVDTLTELSSETLASVLDAIVIDGGGACVALVLIMSHLVADAWSLRVVARELEALYAHYALGTPCSLPSPETEFADFALGEARRFLSARPTVEGLYWADIWSSIAPHHIRRDELPFSRTTTTDVCHDSGYQMLSFDEYRTTQIREFATRRRVTLHSVFRTAMTIVLHYYTQREVVALWGNFANRRNLVVERTIGWFAQRHLVVASIRHQSAWLDVLRSVAGHLHAAQQHESLPLVALWIRIGKELDNCDTSITFDFLPSGRRSRFQLFTPIPLTRLTGSRDLDVRIRDAGSVLSIVGHYNPQKYTRDGIARMMSDLKSTVLHMVDAPDAAVGTFGRCITQ